MHPALRSLNPFKRRSRYGSRRRHRAQRTPYVVLSIGAVLFSGAIAFMMWPGASDGYIDSKRYAGRLTPGQSSDQATKAVASDQARQPAANGTSMAEQDAMQVTLTAVGQTGSEKPSQHPDVQAAIRECANRRTSLEGQSRAVDRFNPEAVSNLNIEIALYNSQCAVRSARPSQPVDNPSAGKPSADNTVAENMMAENMVAEPVDQQASSGTPEKSGPVVVADAKPAMPAPALNLPMPNDVIDRQAKSTGEQIAVNPDTTDSAASLASKPDSEEQPVAEKRPMVSHKPMADDISVKKEPVGWNPTVMTVQSLLTKRGYFPGPVDGFMGKRTQAAVESFQRDQKRPVDGRVTIALLESILTLEANDPGKADPNKSAKPTTTAKPSVAARPVVHQAADRETQKLAMRATGRVSAGTKPKAGPPAKSVSKPSIDQAPAKAATPARAKAPPRSLAKLTRFERQTVEWACANRRNISDNANAYNKCVSDQLSALSDVATPNLDLLNAFDRTAIERLCAGPRYQYGLAAFYQCVNKQQKGLANVHRKPNINDMSADIREMVKSKCDGLQFSQSLPAYYRCVDMQVSQARR